jgi:sporulation protein YlmC with PRC-barrel domain
MNYMNRDTHGIYKNNRNTRYGPQLMGADTLIGNDVINYQDEDIGTIKELMLDVSTGGIVYAVLSFGSFLGMGEKLFAVPWHALTLDEVSKRFVLDIEKEKLKDAPGFDKDAWPNMADEAWSKQIHTYYKIKPYARKNIM